MKRRAFTLIELLIVLGIVGILAAILWPILTRSRESGGPRNVCPSQLKQIALGLLQYSQDYNEHFPNIAPLTTPPYGWADALQPYLKSTQIFHCPVIRDHSRAPDPAYSHYTDYWLNTNVAGRALKYFEAPRQTLFCGEGNDGADQTDARYNRHALPQSWLSDQSSPAFRHDGYANYLFADGHVKALPPDKISIASVQSSEYTFSIH